MVLFSLMYFLSLYKICNGPRSDMETDCKMMVNLLTFVVMCGSRKYPFPPQRELEILERWGDQRTQKFQRGGG